VGRLLLRAAGRARRRPHGGPLHRLLHRPRRRAGFGPDDLRVSFDVAPDDDSTYYVADHIVLHPDWLTAPPCVGNSKHRCLASPAEDIALVFLRETVAGVTPSPIAGPGYFDGLDVTSETFTVVGYGTDDFILGSALSPNQVTVFDGVRSYREVTASTRTMPSPTGSSR
jgi:hypothetical protein